MSIDEAAESELEERTKWTPWAIVAAILLLLLFGVIAVTAIRGFFYGNPQEEAKLEEDEKKKEEEKKKKPDFEVLAPVVQPSESETGVQAVKPGHWAATSQKMRANYRDFVGDSRLTITNNREAPYPVANTPFFLRASRPVLLTKGRPKATESTLFVPPTNQTLYAGTTLEERGLGLSVPSTSLRLTRMPSYQYHFVVMAKELSRYGFVKHIDSVRVPFDGESDADDTDDPIHYRVSMVDVTQTIPLPDNPLTWTSVAYILWDEVDPALFSPEQERALVDWIHWGGQLIISGPDSLDALQNSFLAPFLPATSSGPRTIAADDPDLAEFNNGWMIANTGGEPLRPTAPWSAVKLEIAPEGAALPNSGNLVAERRLGRGRIVVSAFQLAERDLVNWRHGFESWFNACLLRRPPREYRKGYFGDVTLAWADSVLADRRLDARLTTNLRYFARDLGVETAYRRVELTDENNQIPQFNQFGQQEMLRQYAPPEHAGGIGAWNDFSATADAARTALREAAGVEVPDAGFVVMCLVVYLVALVPLNWLIFHTVGRVEWAWIAAPIIAVAGTFVVVHQAQLDIGFVRAQTEIGLLELQPEHPRAHLSRFTALYTSLSTTYELEFANLTTLVAPFATQKDYQLIRGQGHSSVDFRRYDDVRLAGMPISSNSTGMVHSEQMFGLDGPIRLGQSTALGNLQIENRSKFALQSVCIVRRPARDDIRRELGEFAGQWIGELLPGQSVAVSFQPLRIDDQPAIGVAEAGAAENSRVDAAFAKERVEEGRLRGERLNLEPMFRLALDSNHMEDGEVRLVARVDEVLPGETITPAASQIRGATLVVAHLKYAPLPTPRKDLNVKRDIKADADEPAEDESFDF
jgi:hypothetical protein